MNLIQVKSNAKINIGLEIVNKRNDGYHNIRSIFQEIDLCDHIELKKNNQKNITISCSDPSIPTNKENTVFKAANFLLDKISGVDIAIDKQIPHQAGLGGGSSNAAAVLFGLNKLFELKLTDLELKKYAEQIGADVPFFLSGKQAFVSGIGNIIEPVQFKFEYQIVLMKPNISFSTKDIYQNYSTFLGTNGNNNYSELLRNPVPKSFKLLDNSLEKAINDPIIQQLKDYLNNQGAFFSSMSGSGSVVYGLFERPIELVDIPESVGVYYCNAIT